MRGAHEGAVGPGLIEREVKVVSAGVDELSSMNLAEQGPSDETGSTVRKVELASATRASPDAEASVAPPTALRLPRKGGAERRSASWLGGNGSSIGHTMCAIAFHGRPASAPARPSGLAPPPVDRIADGAAANGMYREVELGFRHAKPMLQVTRGALRPVQRRRVPSQRPAHPCGRERRILATKLEGRPRWLAGVLGLRLHPDRLNRAGWSAEPAPGFAALFARGFRSG